MPRNRINPIDQHVGERVRLRRQLLKISMAEAAARLGVTIQVLAEFESGELRIDATTLYRLTGLLGVNLRHLYAGVAAPHAAAPRAQAG